MDKDLVHEFVNNDGLDCLIKVGAEADQNYQNYILRGKSIIWMDKLFLESYKFEISQKTTQNTVHSHAMFGVHRSL